MSMVRYAPDGDSYGFDEVTGFRQKRKKLKKRFDGARTTQIEPDPRLDDLDQQPFDDPTPHRDPLPRPHRLMPGVPVFSAHDRVHFQLGLILGRPNVVVSDPRNTYYLAATAGEDIQNADIADFVEQRIGNDDTHFSFTIPSYSDNRYLWYFQHPQGRPVHHIDMGFPFSAVSAFAARGQQTINSFRYDAFRSDLLLPVFSGGTVNMHV